MQIQCVQRDKNIEEVRGVRGNNKNRPWTTESASTIGPQPSQKGQECTCKIQELHQEAAQRTYVFRIRRGRSGQLRGKVEYIASHKRAELGVQESGRRVTQEILRNSEAGSGEEHSNINA